MAIIQPYTREALFNGIPNLSGKLLLDLGCGEHRQFSMDYLLNVYRQMLTRQQESETSAIGKFEKRVVAVDSAYDSLQVLKTGVSVCADARKLPFPDGTFDIVAVGWLYNCLRDSKLERAVAESVRVLKSQGHLIGDVRLIPTELGLADFDVYLKQIQHYKTLMSRQGLTFLMDGIGFNSDMIVQQPAFYFSALKSNIYISQKPL